MSVRVMNKGSSVEASGGGYVHGIPFISMIDSSPEICNGDRRFSVQETVVARPPEVKKKVKTCSSSSTSSIGKDSDVSSGKSVENSGDSDEVQSRYKGPLDAMEALEEVLPIRRGISRFYNGKSKSFASLREASSSVKDLAKPENAYMRRRRNLMAASVWDKNYKTSPLKTNSVVGGITKRITTANRTTALAFAVSMTAAAASGNNWDDSSSPNLTGASPLLRSCLNPQSSSTPKRNFSAWRSYSLADLQQCVVPAVTGSSSCTASDKLDVKTTTTSQT